MRGAIFNPPEHTAVKADTDSPLITEDTNPITIDVLQNEATLNDISLLCLFRGDVPCF